MYVFLYISRDSLTLHLLRQSQSKTNVGVSVQPLKFQIRQGHIIQLKTVCGMANSIFRK